MAAEEDNDQNEVEIDEHNNNNNNNVVEVCMSRKEKRKLLKKLKRKQLRRDAAIKEREIEAAVSNDPETQARLLRLEQEEAERMERDRLEFEERERLFALALEMKKRREEEEEEERRKRDEDVSNRDLAANGDEDELNEGDDWEYVEEGPAEIIWKGNEIIVKKKKVKVPKKAPNLQIENQECERPISNPLAPQSEAFKDHRTAQEVLESVAQQVPNFGTEQDKAHCPFHLKTGACRFGTRCSRAHFYPDKSCTLLFKNMYSGPGLAWEQDEGLEYTDDEAERAFEEFYEDVHTEFLKFGELVNFKVCRNASSHLRGNVYVHYKFLESAMLAYQSINGRYFAGKQLSCEFVNLTKWKAAICGEYMKSRLKTCSRGSVCNFIHCFQNPGGDYEWADWDKPAPRYWQNEMGALFGYKDDRSKDENLRYSSRRSRSRGPGSPRRKTHSDEDNDHRRRYQQKHRGDYEENRSSPRIHRTKRKRTDSVDGSDCSSEEQISRHNSKSKREKHLKLERHVKMNREHQAIGSDDESRKRESGDRSLKRKSRTSSWQKHDNESVHEHHSCEKSPHMEKHLIYRKHEKEDSLQKTKEAFSSDIDFARDGSVRDKNRRHRRESLRVKVEAYLSDNDSYDGRFVGHVSPQKNMRNVDVSNDKSEYRESNSKNDSLESAEDKYHNHSNSSRAVKNNSNSALDGDRIEVDGKRRHRSRRKSRRSENRGDFTDSESERLNYHNHSNSSRAVKNNSNSALDGDRIEVDGKRRHRSRRKSRRSENRGDFTDSESERLKERSNDRHRRSTKNRKQVRHEAESSDSGSDRGMPRRYEEKPKVDRRIRSRSKSDLRSVNGEEKDDGCGERSNMPHMEHDSGFKSPGDCERPEVKEKADEAAVGNFRVEETTTSERGEICYRNSSSQSIDGEAAFDLEQTYRIAALKKLEEMRKCKDTLLVQSRKLNMSVEIHSNENTTVEGAEGIDGGEEISASRETGTRVASERRKRI